MLPNVFLYCVFGECRAATSQLNGEGQAFVMVIKPVERCPELGRRLFKVQETLGLSRAQILSRLRELMKRERIQCS